MKPYYEQDGIVIYHGDARDVLPMLSANVLFTDPDYGVGMDYGHAPLNAAAADALLTDVLQLTRVSSEQGLMFWSGSWERLLAVDSITKAAGWPVRHMGVWYKPNGAGPSGNGLARRFETWFWLDKNRSKPAGEWRFLPDCIAENRVHPGLREASPHPSQKPERLIRQLVRFFSQPGEVLLDPFMGSGTTLRAAKDLGRRAIGIEISEAYCEIAVKRLAQSVLPFEMPA